MHLMLAASLTIERLIAQRGSLTTLMPEYASRVPENQIPRYKELCFGSCRWYYRIQNIIDQLVERPLKDSEVRVRAILTVAIYQLLETSTPDYAVVNESVDIARKLNKPWAKNLINALLREFIRSKKLMDNNSEEYTHAHNHWFVEKVRQIYPDDWSHIMKANNHRPPMCLRVNMRRSSRESFMQLLGENNIGAYASIALPSAVYLTTPMQVHSIPGFREGLVSVQDEGAQLAAYLLSPEKNATCLDACSAPGGKAGHLLERQTGIHLTALEQKENKLGSITSNMARLKLFAHLQQGDATSLNWWDGRQFDSIMLDAPCSCSGIIRRHPDIRMLLDQKQVDDNTKIQRQIIQQLWQTLRVGGRLLYSTCSIFPEENEGVLDSFTATCGDVHIEPIELPDNIAHKRNAYGVQLLPTMSSHDGFYYALLSKQG